MLPSHGYQGFRIAPIPAGWIQMGESWVLWWNGRQIANISRAKDGGARVLLDARKMWQTNDVRAASIGQGKRYAERWCAARVPRSAPSPSSCPADRQHPDPTGAPAARPAIDP